MNENTPLLLLYARDPPPLAELLDTEKSVNANPASLSSTANSHWLVDVLYLSTALLAGVPEILTSLISERLMATEVRYADRSGGV